MSKSLKKNYFYNTLLLIVNAATSLIISPYISRIFGPEGVGTSALVISTIGIFISLSSLGIPIYAVRQIAKHRNNQEKLNKCFTEILILHICATFFASIIYFLLIFTITNFRANLDLFLIYYWVLFFNVFSVEWLYTGLEEFKYIALRSVFIKIISIILLFSFVKTKNDLQLYIIINAFGTVGNIIFNIIKTKDYVKLTFRNLDILFHVWETKIFFLQILIGSVYQYLDQIILGVNSEEQLAYYSRSRQLISLALILSCSFARTTTPRLMLLKEKNEDEYIKIVNVSFSITFFLVIIGFVLLLSYADILLLFIGGEEFMPAVPSLLVLSILFISSTFAVFLDTQISIPNHREINTLISNIAVAIVCLTLNLLLVSKYGSVGASISIAVAETVGVIIMIFLIFYKKMYSRFIMKINNAKLIICAIFFFLGIYFSRNLFVNFILDTIFSFIFGGIIFILSIFVFSRIFKCNNEIKSFLKILKKYYKEKKTNDFSHEFIK